MFKSAVRPAPGSDRIKRAIGLMSGTSADGIDAVLIEVRNHGVRTAFRQIAFLTLPYPKGFGRKLLLQSSVATARVDAIARYDFLIGAFFADAARRVARKGNTPLRQVSFIGSHGQTIHHLPEMKRIHGVQNRATFQIGNPSVIAKLTGVTTVGDFRSGDIAAGGTGAPLVPFFDYITFRSRTRTRALLNIGGIANITLLPANCTLDEVVAFDTGPGNMIVDGLMRRLFREDLDRDGECAARGMLIPGLLRWMIGHPYFRTPPPKSTGREMFGEPFINLLLRRSRGRRHEDLIATATEFTALSVYDQARRFLGTSRPLSELIVSGGGMHNASLMEALRRYFATSRVTTTDRYGVDPDAKEAICFALLANETLAGSPSNVRGATGARRSTILGTIALP